MQITEIAPNHYGTIYADPPWKYGNLSTRNSTEKVGYDGDLSITEICNLRVSGVPVAEIGTADSHLHLWTTNAFLFDARSVMEAWGYEYRSCFVWVKPQLGMGNYWRVSHEFLLFGKRGDAKFRSHSEKSWRELSRRGHSAKPEEVAELVERVSPGPYLELFARRDRPRWHVWGNQVEKGLFDE